ncbi:MAG TPA: RodZ domain-containing protein [Allosphingosinicella sp.]|nr:RodZ domain-containing protein [Allosphingosinicella sp.]
MTEQDQAGQEDYVSLGERLKRAREAKGMSLDDIAGRTRIPIRHLQNIEREDWDALPAVTYAIGFARNYANAVGLDGAALARELRDEIGGPSHRAAAPEYYAQADPARVPPRSLALIAVVIAAVLITGYLLWRRTLDREPAPIPVAEAPAATPASPAPAPATPQAVAGQPVTLVATGEVWMRISDGPGGPTIFMGSMTAGDRYQLPATARQPLIRTGRPQNLRVAVGTRDLGPLAPTEQVIDDVSLRPEDLAARAVAAPAPAAPAMPPAQ